jgi:prepilin-type N-terminal cleavage/methylation domain-containing protein
MRRKVLGFTLIELMIVIAIIAIIAAIAIPGLLRARISANEGSASASLRSIASAQEQFRKSASVDQDVDGTGEFAVFNELTGADSRRGSLANGAAQDLPALTTTDLSVALQTTANNYSSKSGYYLKMWLPGLAAGTISDVFTPLNTSGLLPPLNLAAPLEDAAIQQQENRWICYAWPATYRSSGVRAFVCDQGAEVFASSNTNPGNNTGYFFGDVAANHPTFATAMDCTIPPTNVVWQNIHIKDNTLNIMDTNHVWVPAGS